jgi:hypothetical protein
MNPTHPSCPSCGTVLTIDHESTVSLVCKRCHAVLEKRGNNLRQVGTAAVAVPTRTSLESGMDGAYQGTRFVITGHVQLSNEEGATWDEFYLGFADGECGWLAQAQGRLILSFRSPLPDGVVLPDFDELTLNQPLDLMKGLHAVHVVEKSYARVEAASGQMPYVLQAGETYPYADFAALSGAFASVDYSTDPPTLFVGREVTFDDLGMQAPKRERGERGTRQGVSSSPSGAPVASGQMRCTECGTDMEIRNPGRTERVTCVKCHALFDVTSGRPQFLGTQEEAPFQPFAPLGAVGRFGGVDLTLIGALQRSTTDEEGTTWFWEEYLLSDEEGGYRWLVNSEGHWNLFEPITGGAEIQPVVHYGGRAYKFFQHGEARIRYLEGEFYWNAAVGQATYTADFVAPPYMLSAEFSSEDSTKGESNWTHGIYVPRAQVQKAFNCDRLPRSHGVGPNQPFPHRRVFPIWGLATLALVIIGVFLLTSIKPETVLKESFKVELPEKKVGAAKPNDPDDAQEISKEINLKGNKNIRIRARADLQSTWMHLTGMIYPKDEDKLVVQPFEIEVWHAAGIEDGEPWTEDNKEDSTYLTSLPTGAYVLRLNVYVDDKLKDGLRKNAPPPAMGGFGNFGPLGAPPAAVRSFEIWVEQGHPRFWHLLVAVLLLAVVPLIVWIWSRVYETKRWSNSNVNPGGT